MTTVNPTLGGGAVVVHWDADEAGSLTLTGGPWTVNDEVVTFPYALTEPITRFAIRKNGTYSASASLHQVELLQRDFLLHDDMEASFAPQLITVGNPDLDKLYKRLVGATYIGIDTDDVPYFDIALPFMDSVPVYADDDGVPYFETGV